MIVPEGSTVFVVDDDKSVREALRGLIKSMGLDCEAFETASAFLAKTRPDGPACLVLDVYLSDENGLDLPRELGRRGDPIPTVFITGMGTIPMTVQAMKAGAVEFLPKPVGDQQLLAAIEQALARDQAARLQRAEQAALESLFATLTPRERDVLALVALGRPNKQIASELGTAEQTVKQQRGQVMRKLGVQSVADLVRLVERYEAPHRTKVS